jgi:Fe-Mn family superoxide dismutase
MAFKLIELPYSSDALEPVISKKTIDFHHGKHLQTYVNNLNGLIQGKDLENKSLEDIFTQSSEGAVFNNAGQILNHNLYFLQFSPKPKSKMPSGKLAEAINKSFESFDKFKEEFSAAAVGLFGSGWAWLSADRNGKLVITKEPNGSNPIKNKLKPLLCIDVWEHAYYLDYQNRRADHVKSIWDIIDWEVVGSRM